MKYDALLQAARLDLETAKKLSKARLFSNSLYNIEQSLEKSSKSLYCYYEITRNKSADKVINKKLKEFGHNNTKMIPEIYVTICNIEESEIGKIPDTNQEIVVVKTKMKQALQELRKSVCNLIGKPPVDQNTLLKDFIDRVNKAYSNYTRLPNII